MVLRRKCAMPRCSKSIQIGPVTDRLEATKLTYGGNWGGGRPLCVIGQAKLRIPALLIWWLVCVPGISKWKPPCRSERLAKYNPLVRIEEELRSNCPYAGNFSSCKPDVMYIRRVYLDGRTSAMRNILAKSMFETMIENIRIAEWRKKRPSG
jgi:hypothetical protein